MASSITPNIPNVPDSSGPAIHPAVPAVLTATATATGVLNFGVTFKKDRRETIVAGQANRQKFHERAKACVEDCPKLDQDPEVREQIARDYLEIGGTTGLNLIESYNKKSLHEKQARLLLANLSLFTKQEIDQLLNLRSDKLP